MESWTDRFHVKNFHEEQAVLPYYCRACQQPFAEPKDRREDHESSLYYEGEIV